MIAYLARRFATMAVTLLVISAPRRSSLWSSTHSTSRSGSNT